MEVFRNTALINEELWKVKHLIELRPVEFKDGVEPSEDDIFSTKISPNGVCEVLQNGHVAHESELRLADGKQWTKRELARDTNRKYHRYQSVFEQNVYTNGNITVVK